jgi:hypothetical protein
VCRIVFVLTQFVLNYCRYWKLKKNIQPLSANGTWRVAEVRLTDLQGNQRLYESAEIETISQAYVDVLSGLCFTSPWLCADEGDPASVAMLSGFWSLDTSSPGFPAGGIKQIDHNGVTQTKNVKTLRDLIQVDDEQDLKRNWLYEFYRRAWNDTNQMFELKKKGLRL